MLVVKDKSALFDALIGQLGIEEAIDKFADREEVLDFIYDTFFSKKSNEELLRIAEEVWDLEDEYVESMGIQRVQIEQGD